MCIPNVIMKTQVRSSYLPKEILWGHRFNNLVVQYDETKKVYAIDHNKLNITSTDHTPRYFLITILIFNFFS